MRYFFVIFFAFLLAGSSGAQVKININFNLDTQPAWGPVGYEYVEYYYIPEIDIYYNVPEGLYFYYYNGHWIGRATLPPRFHSFNVYHAYKVVINENEPWRHEKEYRGKYERYRRNHDQEIIRDSHDPKYFRNIHHPEHKKWVKEHGHDNGKHKGEHK